MGRRLTAIVAGLAVLALIVVAVAALTTQTGQASAQAGQSDAGAVVGANAQTDAAPDCGECAGAQGSGDGAAQECPGLDTQGGQTTGGTGGSGEDGGCCPY